jgi:GT2 family glycosyltransferase
VKVAVVILNWNGSALLKQFLPSVIRYSSEATVYVADNNSDDDSLQVLTALFPEVRIIRNSGNLGYAKGYNEALKAVNEPYYALVNSDIEVTEDWLKPIIQTFDNDSNVGIIQPKILDYKNKSLFEYAGAAGGYLDKYGYPFCRGRIFDHLEADTGQYDTVEDIQWASGACFFIRRDVFRQLEGFDDTFFAHQEEIDLCWRAKNMGVRIKFLPESKVFHVGGATLNQSNPRKTFLNFRNSLLMLTKNLPAKSLYRTLFIRLVLDGAAGVQLFLQGRFTHCWAIVRAHFAFYGMATTAFKKRSRHQTVNYYKIKSVVWSYFIRKQRSYKDLL